MTSVPRWVIGRGLLGGAIADTTSTFPATTIDWSSPDRALASLSLALAEFALTVDDRWEIYWCAGRGVTSTPVDVMESEGRVFAAFTDAVRHTLGVRADGRFFLASSVGGIYAGSPHPPFAESTPPAPLSAYGRTKLAMEESLRASVEGTSTRALVGRITNLYGSGQDLSKGQGLISALIDSSVVGRPISIYVSLDTLRDYIHVDDCARIIRGGVDRLGAEPAGSTTVKIVGSMTAVSIGALIGELSRIRRRRVPIVLGQGDATGQSLDLRVRSEVWRDLDTVASTTLPEGLGELFRSRLTAHMQR
ncbi:NAD-dependent epimerase/dehydratase family protein [uncultured Microbacterium sp.]|uniref:NAD-dependent epimerase/dehydratase family protein n=1 Tax=uncultured Microbacterium sp. TaxID=191216 RepID=UPI00263753FB|nr:NAD-dependent epimerase/dehydratase family protein [uncultured Microbacterium sp.]